MSIYKFENVLNGLMDYFLLGDSYALLQYKKDKNLPDNLLEEFITKETGDKVVIEGILIPMCGVENYPYTIYFNLHNNNQIELLKPENDLQIRKSGYILKVEYGNIYLFTIHYLENFTEESIYKMEKFHKQFNKPTIKIKNDWYKVEILAGQTKQGKYFEPTFEFLITPTEQRSIYNTDIQFPFTIRTDDY